MYILKDQYESLLPTLVLQSQSKYCVAQYPSARLPRWQVASSLAGSSKNVYIDQSIVSIMFHIATMAVLMLELGTGSQIYATEMGSENALLMIKQWRVAIFISQT